MTLESHIMRTCCGRMLDFIRLCVRNLPEVGVRSDRCESRSHTAIGSNVATEIRIADALFLGGS